MLDRDRVLVKLDTLDGYLRELRQVLPATFAEYLASIEKRRACERLLQISIECVLDICGLLVTGLRLGLPSEEDDLLEKLQHAQVLSPETVSLVKTMKGFRNVPVHEYGGIDNAIVFKAATARIADFVAVRQELLQVLRTHA